MKIIDNNGYEIRCYRVTWYVELGWIGDSEGRTWSKELRYQKPWGSKELAEADMESHPETFKDEWGQWRTTYDYGQVRIRRSEELIVNTVTS